MPMGIFDDERSRLRIVEPHFHGVRCAACIARAAQLVDRHRSSAFDADRIALELRLGVAAAAFQLEAVDARLGGAIVPVKRTEKSLGSTPGAGAIQFQLTSSSGYFAVATGAPASSVPLKNIAVTPSIQGRSRHRQRQLGDEGGNLAHSARGFAPNAAVIPSTGRTGPTGVPL